AVVRDGPVGSGDAGAADQDVDGAEGGNRPLGGCRDLGLHRHVQLRREMTLSRQTSHRGIRRLGHAIPHRHARAARGQALRGGEADAGRAARHDGKPPLQIDPVHCLPPLFRECTVLRDRARSPALHCGARAKRPSRPSHTPAATRSPMKVLFTDHDMLDVTLEQRIFDEAGIELATAQCRTEDDVIRAGRGCSALLIQYAPITGRVLEALPEVRLCSRIGAGYDTIDARAAERLGVWLANSPDYGVGEVSLHALSMMLALIRNVVRYD